MVLTIMAYVGWWMIPTFTTILTVCWLVARLHANNAQPAYGYSRIGKAFVAAWYTALALIMTLAAWLAYVIYLASSGG
ncbi:hypothetical protein [Mesorhizobium sp. M8A.F.Ca.ET.021.01.1.1]|uniref:hypothetical protein n=1 Tax=Mesorhizobium sp. M8A.F.Ca.ET.021.01.1.1 TaxID=2496757 RepID=UPI000FCBDA80|nr:hypothetical protein [Mesorhizobium sp. M8A.F.Ca.ET.021.01.1.1]RUW56724.1 hypothetical protein EOA36_02755 [Mesorhizobium sp. M8A.F.Ca.ET.021.01.1.1]